MIRKEASRMTAKNLLNIYKTVHVKWNLRDFIVTLDKTHSEAESYIFTNRKIGLYDLLLELLNCNTSNSNICFI